MKKLLLGAIAGLGMWSSDIIAQTPVYEITMDTAIYEGVRALFCPSPNALGITKADDPNTGSAMVNDFAGAVALFAYHKKNSDQYDIFSFTGKIASVTIPTSPVGYYSWIFFSQFFINDDADWECIATNYTEDGYLFKVFDAHGAVLLSDTGSGEYGYDWQNTYVARSASYTPFGTKYNFKAWRFRTNVSIASPNSLAKTAGSMPHAMMTFGPTGDYRIRLAPASGGKTSVTLMDMLGRQVFSRDVGNLASPVTFTIPETGVPPSPFVTKVQNEKGTVLKKEIPRR